MDSIKWCDPPRKASSGLSKESKWGRMLRPLTERPNVWAQIALKSSPSRASALAYYLRSGKAGVKGEWEFIARECGVWGRFLKKERTITETTQGLEAGQGAIAS